MSRPDPLPLPWGFFDVTSLNPAGANTLIGQVVVYDAPIDYDSEPVYAVHFTARGANVNQMRHFEALDA